MGDIFSNSYFDIHNDDSQFLDVVDSLARDRKLDDSPKILIHADVHSDLYKNNLNQTDGYESIGNWINSAIADDSINEIYWLLPDETESAKYNNVFWGHTNTHNGGEFWDGPADQTFWVDSKGTIYFDDPHAKGEKAVLFHKRLLRQMPSFKNTKEPVILNIDFDYFDFNGNQASQNIYIHNSSTAYLNTKLAKFVQGLNKINLKPILVTCSRSQEYTAGMGHELEKFCRYIGLNSKKGISYLFSYHHQNNYWGERTTLMTGENIARDSYPISQYIYLLQTTDMLFGNDDGIVNLVGSDTEFNKGLSLIRKYTAASEDDVLKALGEYSLNQGKREEDLTLPKKDEMYY